ncbi:MAG: tetratricopeptide repeat protein [Prevotellaceae bacterium]|nr:tetratricopeptide repeat protein [Prevotellaceae bacterium]
MKQEEVIISNKNKYLTWKNAYFALSVILLVVMFTIVPKIGDVGDEFIDGLHGKYALAYYTERDTTFANYPEAGIPIPFTQKYYGAGFEILPAIALKYFNLGKYEYEIRHLLCAIFGFFFMFFGGLIGQELKNWRIAILCLLIMAFTPVIFGLSFIASKDIPFATGFAVATYGFLRIFKRFPNLNVKDVAIAILGIAIAVSVRIGGLLLPFYFVFGLLLLITFNKPLRKTIVSSKSFFFKIVGISAGMCAVGILLGLLFYPNFFYEGPIQHLINSILVMSKFPYRISVLWEGNMISSLNLPSNYLFKSYLITIPLFVFLGIILLLINIKRVLREYSTFQLCFLLFTVVFPIAYLLSGDANLYNGWRHSTFVYSSFVPFSAIGFHETRTWFSDIPFIKKLWKYLYPAIIALCIFPTTKWMVKNYKYTYAYYNIIAGNPHGRYDVEYSSTAEVVSLNWLVKNILTDTSKNYKVMVKSQGAEYHALTKKYPNITVMTGSVRQFASTDCDYAILGSIFLPPKVLRTFYPPKGTIHVERIDNNPICAVVEKNPLDAKGIYLIQSGNFVEGMKVLEQAYDYNSNNFGLWFWMGYGYHYTQDYDKSIEFLSKHVNFWPSNNENIFALAHIGASYIMQKKYDVAIQNLILAKKNNVNNDEDIDSFITANLGLAYYHNKDCANAKPHLEKAVARYPHLRNALQTCN